MRRTILKWGQKLVKVLYNWSKHIDSFLTWVVSGPCGGIVGGVQAGQGEGEGQGAAAEPHQAARVEGGGELELPRAGAGPGPPAGTQQHWGPARHRLNTPLTVALVKSLSTSVPVTLEDTDSTY